ncbi:ACT domain-containing protein [Clostridium estertheticum]|uniref:Amino acid-binding protein n=1 Tax=Clostridium estertheticum subsp. estertheticum TaxID=1552 RepID=A0A1J0GHL3_9CLOT|nr:ACT domain-containing protein [Clostridium estertheticum]APC40849.1 amino acid-binding protein [Clostridium estertheticum subsp. estertheticum]MBU3073901.1 ACT domain-containing protein [Clostridium estertheticum]MBU3163996.1 ACT domain-containing protein [Clostridium estertheticum]MBZ9617294.1 ACT domain-containing protein [Clostridium estertheticum subsp. laramiense]WAG72983.1 ACT domain-containing protein [Clostridium estertheticum]
MSEKILTMKLLNEKFSVCRLNKNEQIPEWVKNSSFYSISKTSDELSIVCSQDSIPSNIKCEKDWRILKVEGPLDFSLIGIISSISTILALKRISIFAVSTYDTDYILVKNKDIDNAILALSNERYEIINQENLL